MKHQDRTTAQLLKENQLLHEKINQFIEADLKHQVADNRLKNENTILANALDTANIIMVILDTYGTIIRFNKACERITGYSANEAEGKILWDLLLIPEEIDIVRNIFQRLNTGDYQHEHEHYWVAKTGARLSIYWSYTARTDEKGEAECIIGTGIDITDRKTGETTLRQSEEQFGILAEQSPNMIFINQKGNIVYANNKCEKVMGYKLEELLSPSFDFRRLIAPESHGLIEEAFRKHMRQEEAPSYEYSLLTKDGKRIEAIITTKLIDYRNSSSILGIITDITDRKQAEEASRVSETRWHSLVQHVPDIVTVIDRNGIINFVNRTISGADTKDIIGKCIFDYGTVEERKTIQMYVDRVFETGERQEYEIQIHLTKDITPWLTNRIVPIKQNNNVINAIIITSDITYRKQAEEEVRASEERFRSLIQNSMDLITLHDKDTKILYTTPSLERILGYSPLEFIGKKALDFIHPDDFPVILSELEKVFQRRNEGVPTEYRIRHANGSWIWFETVANNQLDNPMINGMIMTSRDISERKLGREQLRALAANIQRIREEESTRIAREIHDELGQTLTGIKMDLSFMEDNIIKNARLSDCEEILKKIASIESLTDSAIHTMRKITTELRPAILDSMGLSAAIEWQAEEFEHRTGVRCKYIPPPTDPIIDRNHATAIFRILQESLTNITRHAKASNVIIHFRQEQSGIHFEITDNGRGITESEMNKTNSFGILGIKERVWLLGGTFEIRGIPNQGTCIKVTIP